MTTFRHSGTTGDLIYSLYMVKKMGGGQFQVGIENLENVLSKYGYQPAHIDPLHRGRFSFQDYLWLKPLLEKQSYITSVGTWTPGTSDPDVDLDAYRGVLYRTFEGNILEAYHRTFGMEFTTQDYQTPWLEVEPKTVAPIVVSRSARYHPRNSEAGWGSIIETGALNGNAIFVGTLAEHEAFNQTFGTSIEYYPVTDFHELAQVIAGSDLLLSNQGFAYSLAIGLGKNTLVQLNDIVPPQYNECFFQRENCQYF